MWNYVTSNRAILLRYLEGTIIWNFFTENSKQELEREVQSNVAPWIFAYGGVDTTPVNENPYEC